MPVRAFNNLGYFLFHHIQGKRLYLQVPSHCLVLISLFLYFLPINQEHLLCPHSSVHLLALGKLRLTSLFAGLYVRRLLWPPISTLEIQQALFKMSSYQFHKKQIPAIHLHHSIKQGADITKILWIHKVTEITFICWYNSSTLQPIAECVCPAKNLVNVWRHLWAPIRDHGYKRSQINGILSTVIGSELTIGTFLDFATMNSPFKCSSNRIEGGLIAVMPDATCEGSIINKCAKRTRRTPRELRLLA